MTYRRAGTCAPPRQLHFTICRFILPRHCEFLFSKKQFYNE